MDKWQKRNERLANEGREEKINKSKANEKRKREARKKVENMTKQEKQNRDLEILAKVRAERGKARGFYVICVSLLEISILNTNTIKNIKL